MNFNRNDVSRRLLIGSSLSAACATGLLIAGCGGGSGGSSGTSPSQTSSNGLGAPTYLNYLLNLEYLDAEYFSLAATGTGLESGLTGGAASGPVTGGGKVPFSTAYFSTLAQQFAVQERNQVIGLRDQLFSAAVSRPSINFTSGFSMIGSLAGFGSSFNPFADEHSFLLGAFFLEDLMATAYAGVISQDPAILGPLLGEEAYHAGIIRSVIATAGGSLLANADSLSAVRSSLGQGGEVKISSSVAPATGSGGVPLRIPSQILNVFYGNVDLQAGSFFPRKLNGTIS